MQKDSKFEYFSDSKIKLSICLVNMVAHKKCFRAVATTATYWYNYIVISAHQ